MKSIFLECFSGISADMFVASMLDLGLPFEYLKNELNKLPIRGDFKIQWEQIIKNGITGQRFYVIVESHEHPHRPYSEIKKLLNNSSVSKCVIDYALAIFERLAKAEGKIHNKSIDEVTFHEVGAIDSIVDICSAAIALEYFKMYHGVERIFSTPPELGGGFVQCAHGLYPVPAPATSEILCGLPVTIGLISKEMTTPIGAAILAECCDFFLSSTPSLRTIASSDFHYTSLKSGYGFGERTFHFPNAIRASLIEKESPLEIGPAQHQMIEVNLDDMNPEFFPEVAKRILDSGAIDIWYFPIVMKKGRLATSLQIFVKKCDSEKIRKLVLEETTTIGLRYWDITKQELERKQIRFESTLGEIGVKISGEGRNLTRKIEFESIKEIANKHNLTLGEASEKLYSELHESTIS